MTVTKNTQRAKPDPELIKLADSLLANYQKPADLIGENGLLKQLTKLLVERALEADLTEHLGHDQHEAVTNTAGNARNGRRGKTLKGDFGEFSLAIPRDRHAVFEPQLVAKHQTRWTGFSVYPKACVQRCIVRRVRHSLNFVAWKARKEVAADGQLIDASATNEIAAQRLADFEPKWDGRYPSISLSWRRNWARITPFFAYLPAIRQVIDTPNAIESFNMSLRKVGKTRASFPSDEAVSKLVYLALNNSSKQWTMPIADWKAALNRCPKQFEDRQFGTSLLDEAKVAPKLADGTLCQQANLREQPMKRVFFHVQADKLEALNNTVGELVILGSAAKLPARASGDAVLLETTHQMGSLVEEIRHSSLALRRVAIGDELHVLQAGGARYCRQAEYRTSREN